MTTTEPSIEEALSEVRKLVGPYPQLIVDVRDCGQETRGSHGRIEYGIQIGMNGEQFTARTMAKVLAQVRQWHAEQAKEGVLMAAKAEITHRCEAPWRHAGTRKVESHTYPWEVNGEYRRLCWPCWQKVDAERGIKRGVKE